MHFLYGPGLFCTFGKFHGRSSLFSKVMNDRYRLLPGTPIFLGTGGRKIGNAKLARTFFCFVSSLGLICHVALSKDSDFQVLSSIWGRVMAKKWLRSKSLIFDPTELFSLFFLNKSARIVFPAEFSQE